MPLLFILSSCDQNKRNIDQEITIGAQVSSLQNSKIPKECNNVINIGPYSQLIGTFDSCFLEMNEERQSNNIQRPINCIKRIMDSFKNIKAKNCQNDVGSAVKDGMEKIVFNYSKKIKILPGATDIDGEVLRKYFKVLKVWSTTTKELFYNSAENSQLEEYIKKVSTQFSFFWNHLVKSISNEDLFKKDDTIEFSLGVNPKILQMGIEEEIDDVALILLFGQTMGPIYKRMEIQANVQDIECRIKKCKSNQSESELNQLFTFFSNIFNPQIEDIPMNELRSLTHFSSMIESMKLHHDYLIGVFDKIKDLSIVETPNYARALVRIVNDSKDKFNNFRKVGLYSGRYLTESNFGFSEKNKNAIIGESKKVQEELQTALNSFTSKDKPELIRQILTNNDGEKNLARLKSALKKEKIVLFKMIEDVKNIQSSFSHADYRFGEYIKNFNSAIKSTKWENLYGNQSVLEEENKLALSSSDLKYTESFLNKDNYDLSEIAVRKPNGEVFKITGNIGDIVNITAFNLWSPTCALQKSNYNAANIENVKVDSAGLPLSIGQDDATTDSNSSIRSEDKYSSRSINATVCAGGSLIGGSANVCASASTGIRISNTKTKGHSEALTKRTSASFNLGLRLEGTPFPEYTAGSLLLVELPRNQIGKSKIKNVFVVNQNFAHLISSESDFYLIGNDCAGSDVSQLVIDVKKMITAEKDAKKVVDSMIFALAQLENDSSDLLKNGQVGPVDLANLRAAVFAKLAKEGTIIQGPILKELFEYWLSHEMSIIDRKSRLISLERQIVLSNLSVLSLNEEITFQNNSQDINGFYKLWLLENMELDEMGHHLDRALVNIGQRILPIVNFFYPELLIDKNIENELNQLSLQKFNSSLQSYSKVMIKLLEAFNSSIDSIATISPADDNFKAGLYFPNPYYPKTCDGGPALKKSTVCVDQLPDYKKSKKYPVADMATAEKIWSDIYHAKTKFEVLIEPSDLYVNTTHLKFKCNDIRPVLTNMAVHFIHNEGEHQTYSEINSFVTRLTISTNGVILFPGSEKIDEYRITDSAWKKHDAPMTTGPFSEMEKNFIAATNEINDFGAGRSPFSHFTISDLPVYEDTQGYLNNIKIEDYPGFFILFDVRAVNNGEEIKWLKRCENR